MARPLAILGSARSDGHTAALLKRLIDGSDCEVIDLNLANISCFRYDQNYADDDEFLALVERMIAAPIVIFATPVYWYSFSAVMKNFIDRLSDLLMSQKAVGRRLRGDPSPASPDERPRKGRWALVITGSDNEIDRDLASVFRRTCGYLGVDCIAEVYGVEGGPFVDESAVQTVRAHLGIPDTRDGGSAAERHPLLGP